MVIDASAVLGAGPIVSFRSWRTHEGAAKGWEFDQAFYVRVEGPEPRGIT